MNCKEDQFALPFRRQAADTPVSRTRRIATASFVQLCEQADVAAFADRL